MERCDVRGNVTTLQRGLIFHIMTLNPTSRRSREVLFQRHHVLERYFFNVAILKPNVATFLGGIFSMLRRSRDHQPGFLYKKILIVENSLHLALLFPKTCTKLSMLFLLSRSNLGTSKHFNTNTSKLKQEKSNLVNLKQEKMMTKIIQKLGLPPK